MIHYVWLVLIYLVIIGYCFTQCVRCFYFAFEIENDNIPVVTACELSPSESDEIVAVIEIDETNQV